MSAPRFRFRVGICRTCALIVPCTRGDNPNASEESKQQGEHWVAVDHAIVDPLTNTAAYCHGSYQAVDMPEVEETISM